MNPADFHDFTDDQLKTLTVRAWCDYMAEENRDRGYDHATAALLRANYTAASDECKRREVNPFIGQPEFRWDSWWLQDAKSKGLI